MNNQTERMNMRIALCMVLSLLALAPAFGARSGGGADLEFESLNAGGSSFSSNGFIKLGGTLGQNGFIQVTTNTQLALLNGFWKAENSCVLYNPVITRMARMGGNVGLTFLVVNSNSYTVLSVDQEAGGLMGGSQSFTSVVASFEAQGPAGSITNVFQSVGAATNRARYYLIRCAP